MVDPSIPEVFERCVAARPDAIALEAAEGGTRVTYRELDERANALAHRLRACGVRRDAPVAVVLPRGIEAIIALLAVLKAGGAYVPLDPTWPAARLAALIGETRATIAIASAEIAGSLASAVRVLEPSLEQRRDRPDVAIAADDLAYIMFTSGSTGTPKGVLVPHCGVTRLVCDTDFARFGPDEVFLQLAPLGFDAATLEIWGALLHGSRLVVFPPRIESLEQIAETIGRHRITFLWLTAGLFHALVDQHLERLAPLRQLLAGGDVLSPAHVRRALDALPQTKLINGYGPTENTTFTCCYEVPRDWSPERAVPIGRAISRTSAYVLDGALHPVPAGVVGELYAGGDGLARGYLDAALTAERFVPSPFGPAGSRLYRTGDLARVREDGVVEFLGRNDEQVKIRGHRIEPGEISCTLVGLPGIRDATVVARAERGEKTLVAYVVGDAEATTPARLRAALETKLPPYMVPEAFVRLDALPLNANGKVDRRALRPPRAGDFARATFAAPTTDVEKQIASFFAEVLGTPEIGLDDSFFALGGHSLGAARVIARVKGALGRAVGASDLFAAPTVRAFAQVVETAAPAPLTSRKPLLRRSGPNAALSYQQERLWFLDKLHGDSSAYTIVASWRLVGALDGAALDRALGGVVARHEALRTTISSDEPPMQVVHESRPIQLDRVDLRKVPANRKAQLLAERVRRELATPFDLKRGPLLRSKLFAIGEDEHVLVVTMHHIVSDGWSLAIFARELGALYEAEVTGRPSSLAPVSFHYGDFSEWERHVVGPDALERQAAYWKALLEGAPAAIELPLDRPRAVKRQHRGARVRARVAPETLARLDAVARDAGATRFMALLAAFAALVGRLAGQRDVVVAAPVVNRPLAETEAIIGFFMNTLPLRVRLPSGTTFVELLASVRPVTLDGFANRDVPFDRIVQDVNPTRDPSRNPIAQVCLNVLNMPEIELRLSSLESTPLRDAVGGSKFDMTLYVEERDSLELDLVYDPDLYDEARMQRFVERFAAFVERASDAPTEPIDQLSLVLDDERETLPDPRATLAATEHPRIVSSFCARAREMPERAAVGDTTRQWTYGELAARTSQLAHALQRTIRQGDAVAILAERNALTVWAMLAVLEAGGAFVLLDPDYPAAQLAQRLTIAKPTAFIVAMESADSRRTVRAVASGVPEIDLGDPGEPWRTFPTTPPPVVDSPRAYMSFTSGTTGEPRAIIGADGPVAHFVAWQAAKFELGPNDRFSALSGLAHDPFLRDVLTPLTCGASVHFPPASARTDPKELARWLAAERITVTHMTPSLGEVLSLARGASLPALRYVFFAGEPLQAELVASLAKIAPAANFVNFYGTTETPQAMSFHRVSSAEKSGRIPIGRGIDGVQLLVVNDGGGLATIDEPGEIVVRTRHLAIGYADGTQGGFGTSAFSGDARDRVYRTGDRGRYRGNGEVELLGRTDDQVKVRGFRVELAEVERALRAQPGVRQAAVALDAERRGLVAYVSGDATSEALGQSLRKLLPDYMVPSVFLRRDTIPLTPNGKIDRRALSASAEAPQPASEADAPRGRLETAIAEIWKDVLGLASVDRLANFFDVGGHSLLAMQIATRLSDALSVDVPVRLVFEAPTVATLAERLVEANGATMTSDS